MEARANLFEDGFERVQARFRTAGEELQKLQERADENRRDLSDRAQARAEKVQKQLLEIPAIKAADDYRMEVLKQIESNMDEFLNRLPVASSADIKKLEKKVNALTRKVRALEKAQEA
jgi:hypothetical protein